MGVDVAGVDAAFGEDVDPDAVEFQRPIAEVEGQIAREGGDVGVEGFDQISEDREAVGQVVERGIGGVAREIVFFAPILARFIVIGDGDARGFEFFGADLPVLRKMRLVKAGREEGFDLGHT